MPLKIFIPPVFSDENKTNTALLLHIFLWGLNIVVFIAISLMLVLKPEFSYRWLTQAAFFFSVDFILLYFSRKGFVRLSSILFVLAISSFTTSVLYYGGGIRSVGVLAFLILIYISGLLLGKKVSMLFTALFLTITLIISYIESIGQLPESSIAHSPISLWIMVAAYLIVAVLLQSFASTTIEKALNKAKLELEERKKVEATLRDSEMEYRMLFEESPEGIMITNSRNEIILANPSACEILGNSEYEILGKTPGDFVDREDLNIDPPVNVNDLQDGKVIRKERKIERKDGKKIFIRTNIKKIKEGRYQYLFEDISEKRINEQKLIESEEKFRQLTENIEYVFWLRTDTQFLYVSPAFEKIWGRPCSLLYENAHALIDSLYREDKLKYIQKLESDEYVKKGTFNIEFRIIRPDGTIRNIHAKSFPIYDNAGKMYRLAGIAHDITELKFAEIEHLRLQNLESLGVLAGGIAHDFNNMLTAIHGRITLAKMNMPDGKAKEHLIAAENAVHSAVGLTKQLLTFSKGGAPEKCLIPIKKIIYDTANFCVSGSSCSVKFDLLNTFNIEADPGQISQVIQNLVINAKQSMASGGIIDISSENYLNENQEPFVRIKIKDSGIGIPEKHINKIFDPYFTTKQTGSGLGLSVSHSVIVKHGGNITVDSNLGSGTTFNILLPASNAEQPDNLYHEKKIDKILNILIMDDDADVREILSGMLESSGHKVTISREGDEAFRIYNEAHNSKDPFDIVLLDLTIKGGKGGKETVHELRNLNPLAKIIVTSGYAGSTSWNYKNDGFDGKLNKPFSFKELNEVIYDVFYNKGF